MLPADTLHSIPKGIVEMLWKILQKHTNGNCDIIDERLSSSPVVRDPHVRGLHYRAFNSGIATMSVFTADDYIALLQQLPYVVGTGTGTMLVLDIFMSISYTIHVYFVHHICLFHASFMPILCIIYFLCFVRSMCCRRNQGK